MSQLSLVGSVEEAALNKSSMQSFLGLGRELNNEKEQASDVNKQLPPREDGLLSLLTTDQQSYFILPNGKVSLVLRIRLELKNWNE